MLEAFLVQQQQIVSEDASTKCKCPVLAFAVKFTLVYAVSLYVHGKHQALSYENIQSRFKDHNNSSVWLRADREHNKYSTWGGRSPAVHGHFSLCQVDKNINGYISPPILTPGAHRPPVFAAWLPPSFSTLPCPSQASCGTTGPIVFCYMKLLCNKQDKEWDHHLSSLSGPCVHWCGVNAGHRERYGGERKWKWKSRISQEPRRCNYTVETVA